MSTSKRRDVLHRILCTDQKAVSQSAYLDLFGLFVDENQSSRVEVTVTDPAVDERVEAGDSPTSSITLTEQLGLPIDPKYEQTGFRGFRHFLFDNADDIVRICDEDRCGLTMIHIKQQEHSRSRLHITRSCFERLIQSLGMFLTIRDMILYSGVRDAEVEVAPPSLRVGHLFTDCSSGSVMAGHQVSYGLRYMQHNGKSWSLRQFFVYNMTDTTKDSSKWVMFCLPDVIRGPVNDYLELAGQDALSHPGDIHALLCSSVVSMWRPYFVDMSKQIEHHMARVEMTDFTDAVSAQTQGSSTLGAFKGMEFELLNALLALRSTRDTSERIGSLLADMPDLSVDNRECQRITQSIFSYMLRDIDMLIHQAVSLLHKAQSLSALHASFLDLANGFSLQSLAEQQAKEGEEMKTLTTIATRDTKAVKALSIMTLVYLPVTVVFNFFSTSFVDNGGGSLQLLGNWWLLLAISLPLTVLTLFIWVICVWWSGVHGSRGDEEANNSMNLRMMKQTTNMAPVSEKTRSGPLSCFRS